MQGGYEGVSAGVLAGVDGDSAGDLGHRSAGITQGPDLQERVVATPLPPPDPRHVGGASRRTGRADRHWLQSVEHGPGRAPACTPREWGEGHRDRERRGPDHVARCCTTRRPKQSSRLGWSHLPHGTGDARGLRPACPRCPNRRARRVAPKAGAARRATHSTGTGPTLLPTRVTRLCQ